MPLPSSPSHLVRPLRLIQSLIGTEFEIDVASINFLIGLILAFTALTFLIWRHRKQRLESYLQAHAVGTPGHARLIQSQENIILQKKELGNRAYLDREYERAAFLFSQATDETIVLCKMQYPDVKVKPFTIELDEKELARQLAFATASPTFTAEPTGVDASRYPPPGYFRTKPNPELELIATPMLNNLAVYASNRAACLLALNRYEDALIEAENARHIQPLWSKGYLRAGQAYEGLGLLARAKAMYTAGARADASDENVTKCLRNLQQLWTEVEETKREIDRERKRLSPIDEADSSLSLTSSASSLSTTSQQRTENDRFDALISWLTKSGASFPYLYLKQYQPDHRGVHSLCRLSAGKILLSIPLSCIMTSDLARQSYIGRAIEKTKIELSSNHSYLACFLLEQRYKASKVSCYWKPYIDILPKSYRNMPLFFTDEEKSWLKGSFTLPKIDERYLELKAEYQRLCERLDTFELEEYQEEPKHEEEKTDEDESASSASTLTNRKKTIKATASSSSTVAASSTSSPPTTSKLLKFSERHSLNDFIWARTVVITRVFGFSMTIQTRGATGAISSMPYKTDGLVPMADMLNHKRPRESSWNYDDSRSSFVITSLVNFAPRQELCDSYGRKCNSRFFVNYGFCLEDNKDDNQAVIWIPLDAMTKQEDTNDLTNEVQAKALFEKKRRLLGLEKTAAGQTLAQSASSLSSSSYILSTTTASSSSVYDAPVYPPPQSLRFQIPANYNDKITQEIFSLLRFLVASSTSPASTDPKTSEMSWIEAFLTRPMELDQNLRAIPSLNIRNESAVLELIKSAAELALKQFDTTKAQDDEILNADDAAAQEEEKLARSGLSHRSSSSSSLPSTRLTSNQRNCVLMRRGEKEVYQYYLDLYQEVQTVLTAYQRHRLQTESSLTSSSSSAASSSSWSTFVRNFIDPRYSVGEGEFDYYISTVIIPILQIEEQKRG